MDLDGDHHHGRDGADMLSELHDDVLLKILERVGMLDAIRACAVSKRMLKLPAMLSRIVIVLGAHELVRKNAVVAEAVHKILSTRSPRIPIRELKLKFLVRGDDHLRIGRSVALAMATQMIDATEFEILPPKDFHDCTYEDSLQLTAQFNAFIGECPDAFAGLTRLHLRLLKFDESDVPNILRTCKRLESLHLLVCGTETDSALQVEHARLVELDINYGLFGTVELNCLPNLQHMTYHNLCFNENPLLLGFVPRLSELSLTNVGSNSVMALNLCHLLANVPSVRKLHLDFQSEKIKIKPECWKLPTPSHGELRFVNLDNLPEQHDITWTLFFLEAVPSLEELCITVCDHPCQMKSEQKSYSKKTDVKWEPYGADFKHKNLAKLTIHGFESDNNFIRYVRRVMEVAMNIHEISLHDRKICKVCTEKFSDFKFRPTSYPRTYQEKNLVRKNIIETLVAASPSVIRFRPSCYYSTLAIEPM